MGTAETRAPPAYLSATYGFSLVRIVAASVSGIPVVSAVSLRAQRLLLFWRYMYLQVMRNCMVGRSFVSPLIENRSVLTPVTKRFYFSLRARIMLAVMLAAAAAFEPTVPRRGSASHPGSAVLSRRALLPALATGSAALLAAAAAQPASAGTGAAGAALC